MVSIVRLEILRTSANAPHGIKITRFLVHTVGGGTTTDYKKRKEHKDKETHTHTQRCLQLPGPRIPASRYSSTGSAYGLTIGGFKHTCTKCAYVHTYSIHTHIQSFPDRHMHQVHRRQWQTHCQKNASGLRHTLVCLQMTLTKTQRMNVCQDDHRGLYLP